MPRASPRTERYGKDAVAADEDPYLWLEEVEGKQALEWVKARSAEDTAEIEAVPEFAELHEKLLEIKKGQGISEAAYHYALTAEGRKRAREVLESGADSMEQVAQASGFGIDDLTSNNGRRFRLAVFNGQSDIKH